MKNKTLFLIMINFISSMYAACEQTAYGDRVKSIRFIPRLYLKNLRYEPIQRFDRLTGLDQYRLLLESAKQNHAYRRLRDSELDIGCLVLAHGRQRLKKPLVHISSVFETDVEKMKKLPIWLRFTASYLAKQYHTQQKSQQHKKPAWR